MIRVLFVDDDENLCAGLQRILRPQRNDWEMAFAPNGAKALTLLAASPFDVVVSDLRMQGMEGDILLARVRNLYPEVVRIVLSGHPEDAAALRLAPIAHQFLTKPCDVNTLRVAIERARHLKVLLHDDAIRSTVGGMGELPALPRTYHALTEALTDPETSIQ